MRFNDGFSKNTTVSGDSNQYVDTDDLIVVGTTKMDEYSRLTISKDIKKVFPISPGDSIIVYQSRVDDDKLILKLQRFNEVVQTWTLTRRGSADKTLTRRGSADKTLTRRGKNFDSD